MKSLNHSQIISLLVRWASYLLNVSFSSWILFFSLQLELSGSTTRQFYVWRLSRGTVFTCIKRKFMNNLSFSPYLLFSKLVFHWSNSFILDIMSVPSGILSCFINCFLCLYTVVMSGFGSYSCHGCVFMDQLSHHAHVFVWDLRVTIVQDMLHS